MKGKGGVNTWRKNRIAEEAGRAMLVRTASLLGLVSLIVVVIGVIIFGLIDRVSGRQFDVATPIITFAISATCVILVVTSGLIARVPKAVSSEDGRLRLRRFLLRDKEIERDAVQGVIGVPLKVFGFRSGVWMVRIKVRGGFSPQHIYLYVTQDLSSEILRHLGSPEALRDESRQPGAGT